MESRLDFPVRQSKGFGKEGTIYRVFPVSHNLSINMAAAISPLKQIPNTNVQLNREQLCKSSYVQR